MTFFSNLLGLFNRRERIKLGLICVILFMGSLLEVAGIGILLPFIKIVGDPDLLLKQARIGPWLNRVGLVTHQQIIVAVCLCLLAFSLFKCIYTAFSMRVSFRFTYGKTVSLARQLLDSYMKAPFLFHLEHNTAELIKNVTIETEHIGGILKFCFSLPTELLVVAGLLVVLLVTEPVAALVGIAVLGTVSWTISAMTRKELSRQGKARSVEHGRMIQSVSQGLGAIKEVKLLGRETFFSDALLRSGRRYANSLRDSTLLTMYPRLIIETVAVALIVILVLLILLSGRDMKTLMGVIAVFGAALIRMVPSASRIMNALNSIRFYGHSVTLVLHDLRMADAWQDKTPAAGTPSISLSKCIEIDRLTYRYPEAVEDSVMDATLTITRGQRVGFVGSSGAGKTTLANLILGLLEPTSGKILVDGVDIRQNLDSWQRRLGYIPQDIYLLDDTIRRNVAFGLPDEKIDDAAVWRALEAAQLGDFVRGLGPQLEAMVGERGVRISAGQRQRVGIARALYHDPDVLLLDEATSALDNETERLFAAAINNLPRTKTLIIIAHRLTTVQRCDTIFVLEYGQITDFGSYDSLLTTSAGFNRMVHGVS